MHLKSFCFILPSEFDEPEEINHKKVQKISAKQSSPRGCTDWLRQSLRRFFESKKWINFCHQELPMKQFSGTFFDAEGVQVQEKVGGDQNPRIFSYSELYIGSNAFHENQILGSGGFGRVYRAVLPSDGTVVAVKCVAERGECFEKTFMAELVAVAHLRHRNLVRLRGWCVHNNELLLVYDYMPNRSLDRVLFKKSDNILTWERRKNIVNGLAAALNYLHENLETQIIHRDVKTSNVMLDSHFNARLGDFGLARWLEHDLAYEPKTPLVFKNRQFRLAETTRIGGTIGYLPPESFEKKVRLSDDGTVLQAGDTRLGDGSYKLSDMERLLQLGLMCTLHDLHSRPSMKWVVEFLSGNIYDKLPDLPSFRFHPLYISLSTPTNTSTSNTPATKSSRTTSISTTAFYSPDFVSPNAENHLCDHDRSETSDFAIELNTTRGWCTEHGEMLVVYDYSSNRLLGHILFQHGQREKTWRSELHWHQRYNIIKSLASQFAISTRNGMSG
ncbi:hypothetical protein DH2020_027738 [Rehmannia glutinosa]|uniref:Protein kinase domain-containing protein n=1 Tax=Rehmannia glutinosa TaxID=99300 RepID=A0ABR0VTC0_REHGL